MKHPIILSALLFGLASNLAAQAPGYLGKRLFVKPEFSSMFAFSNPTASNRGNNTYGEQGNRRGLNTRYGVQLGYTISRQRVVALEANYVNTGMILSAYTPSLIYGNATDEHYLFYNLGGPEAGISLQTYNPLRGSIAPMGFYTAWRARMAFLEGKILDKHTSYAQNDASLGHEPLGIRPRYNHLTVGVEFGQHVVLFDRVLLGISAEINVAPLDLKIEEDYYGDTDSNQEAFKRAAAKRLRWHSLFMFKIGVGYLL